jgi:predicted RND superfamily exporter protein
LLRLLGILALVTVVASLITFAKRIRSTTTIGKKITEEVAEAEKKLALLKKTAMPMPLASWIIIIVAVALLVFGLWALCYGLSTGPPFGW